MNIGIIGYGVVGKSVQHSLPGENTAFIYDPAYKNCCNYTCFRKCDMVFICVPTPTTGGRQDVSIIEATLNELTGLGYKGLVVLKSTILSATVDTLIKYYGNLDIMVAPEFLEQAAPYNYQLVHVLGVADIFQANRYRDLFDEEELFITTPTTACMIKYVHNCFGAMKVTFFNEIFDVCKEEGVNYRELINGLVDINDNVGKSYTKVCADGKRGFGGACFPKDIVAFANMFQVQMLKRAIDLNRDYRKEEMEEVEE